MPWKRYWPGLVVAVPLGALIGAGAGQLVFAAQLGWGSAGALTESGAVLGAIDALLAALGATVGVWAQYRRSGEDSVLLIVAGSVGASAGAAALWLVLGLFLTLMGGLSVLPLAIIFAVVCGFIAGLVCAIFMMLADQIARLRLLGRTAAANQ